MREIKFRAWDKELNEMVQHASIVILAGKAIANKMDMNKFRRGNTMLSMDNNEISSVAYGPCGEEGWVVGQMGVVSIHAYDEFGNSSMVPWLAICAADKVLARLSASDCIVIYK